MTFLVTTDGQELCRLVRLVLTSRKMVLFVPRPWHWCCYRHSWQVVLRYTFNLIALNVTTLVQCGPITHSSTRPKPDSLLPPCFRGYFPVLDLVCNSRATYLIIFSLMSCSVLMPVAMYPSFVIRHRHRMHAYPFETPHTFFCFSQCTSLSLNSEDTLYALTSDNLGWLTRYPSDPPSNFPPSLIISTMKTPKNG